MNHYAEIFQVELGTIKKFPATLHLKGNAPSSTIDHDQFPVIRDAVRKELDQLRMLESWKKIKHADCTAPIVTVPNNDDCFWICGDYNITTFEVDQYPLPKAEDIFTTLVGGDKFMNLDVLWPSHRFY